MPKRSRIPRSLYPDHKLPATAVEAMVHPAQAIWTGSEDDGDWSLDRCLLARLSLYINFLAGRGATLTVGCDQGFPLRRRLERRLDGVIDRGEPDEAHSVPRRLGHVLEVLLVAFGQEDGGDAGAHRG